MKLNTIPLSIFFKHLSKILCFSVCLLVSQASLAAQTDIDKEVNRYVSVLNDAGFQQQKPMLKQLGWSGITSPKVYDVIAEKLIAFKGADNKVDVQQASWFAKALGYSGNDKYRATLDEAAANAKSKKVRKYATQALDNLEQYKAWNPVISANLDAAPSGRLKQARIANMLAAEDPLLMRLGAKRVYHGHKTDAKLVAAAAQRLKSEYPQASKGNDAQIDGLAWLIKVLAESGDKSYRPLLVEIADTSEVKKVKKYAKKYAGYLQ